MYKQQLSTAQDRQQAKALGDLLEANARLNEERRDAAKNEMRRIVDAAGQSNPELRNEMMYSWERGFIKDKKEENPISPKKTMFRKDDLRKTGQALTKPLKGKITSETGSTVKTSGGSIYQKLDIDEAKIYLQPELTQGSSRSPSAEKKLQKISSPEKLEESDLDEELQQRKISTMPNNSHLEGYRVSGGLNLAIKRAKPNKGGPGSSSGPKTHEDVILKKAERKRKR